MTRTAASAGTRTDGPGAPSSLSRGLSLLDAFRGDADELSIGELARRAGLPKTTTHRLASDLLAWGALERGERGLRLGMHLIELGGLVPAHRRLREAATPLAHHLRSLTRLTSNVAVRADDHILYLERLHHATPDDTHAGSRGPLHATALGKVILAHSDPALVETVLERGLEPVAERTIVDPAALRAELVRIRSNRLAFDMEESRPGSFCVAAPVLGRRNAVLGAVSVAGATSFEEARRLAPTVQAAALALSRRVARGEHDLLSA